MFCFNKEKRSSYLKILYVYNFFKYILFHCFDFVKINWYKISKLELELTIYITYLILMGNVAIELEFLRQTLLISFGTFSVHPQHKYIHGFLH